tara:strand:+ start:637 stop:807 length:171 start_codon:yes stop_codon:yes gene_type:complete
MQGFEVALGYGLGIFSAVGMLLMGIAGNLGGYSEFVELMMQMHEFFSLSFMGILWG